MPQLASRQNSLVFLASILPAKHLSNTPPKIIDGLLRPLNGFANGVVLTESIPAWDLADFDLGQMLAHAPSKRIRVSLASGYAVVPNLIFSISSKCGLDGSANQRSETNNLSNASDLAHFTLPFMELSVCAPGIINEPFHRKAM